MHDLIGVMRMYLSKHATILLASVLLFQLAALHAGAQDKPKRPRITGIDHVRLYVTDVDKSRQFYSKNIGLPDHPELGCENAPYACSAIDPEQQIEFQLAPSPAPQNWVAEIGYATDDIEQMRRYVLAHKIAATPTTTDANGARHFELHDPEGNSVAFVQRSVRAKDWGTFNNQIGTRLLHAGFVVKDVAAENKFYLDLLGFKLYWYGGFKDDGVDWYEIQVPDGDNWIEYMLNIPATADHKELGVQNHFSLGVKDIHAAAEQLHKNGLLKFDGPEIGRDGKWGLDAYDPDGTRVEVMEFTPAGKPCCHPYTAPHPTTP